MATSQFKFTLRNTSKNAINCAMNYWMLEDLKVTKSRNKDFIRNYEIITNNNSLINHAELGDSR